VSTEFVAVSAKWNLLPVDALSPSLLSTTYSLYAYVVCDSHSVRHYSQPQSLLQHEQKKYSRPASMAGYAVPSRSTLCNLPRCSNVPALCVFPEPSGIHSLRRSLTKFAVESGRLFARFLHTERFRRYFWSSAYGFHGGFRERHPGSLTLILPEVLGKLADPYMQVQMQGRSLLVVFITRWTDLGRACLMPGRAVGLGDEKTTLGGNLPFSRNRWPWMYLKPITKVNFALRWKSLDYNKANCHWSGFKFSRVQVSYEWRYHIRSQFTAWHRFPVRDQHIESRKYDSRSIQILYAEQSGRCPSWGG
jgi:hypothetical protein